MSKFWGIVSAIGGLLGPAVGAAESQSILADARVEVHAVSGVEAFVCPLNTEGGMLTEIDEDDWDDYVIEEPL